MVEEATEKVCLLCWKLKNIPEEAAKNHTTQECRQFAKFNKVCGEGVDMENSARYRKDSPRAGSQADQRHTRRQRSRINIMSIYHQGHDTFSQDSPDPPPMPP